MFLGILGTCSWEFWGCVLGILGPCSLEFEGHVLENSRAMFLGILGPCSWEFRGHVLGNFGTMFLGILRPCSWEFYGHVLGNSMAMFLGILGPCSWEFWEISHSFFIWYVMNCPLQASRSVNIWFLTLVLWNLVPGDIYLTPLDIGSQSSWRHRRGLVPRRATFYRIRSNIILYLNCT